MIDLEVGEQNEISGGVTATEVYTSLLPSTQVELVLVAAVALLPVVLGYFANRADC